MDQLIARPPVIFQEFDNNSMPPAPRSTSKLSVDTNIMSKKRILSRLPVGQSFITLPADIVVAKNSNSSANSTSEGPATKKLRRMSASDAGEQSALNTAAASPLDQLAALATHRRVSMEHVPPSSSALSSLKTASGTHQEVRVIASSMPRIVSNHDVRQGPSPVNGTNNNSSANSHADGGRTGPQRYLMSLLQSKEPSITTVSSLSLKNYFLEYNDSHYDSYDAESIAAIRGENLDALRTFQGTDGRTLQATNKFGESLLHMACRRSFTRVVHFLLTEAGVSPKVCDDMGRTPLHDACWTCEPNTDLMELLILHCPELLVMKDRRGSAPFEYIRGDHACAWMKFLSENKALIQSDRTISRVKSILTEQE